LKEIKSGEEVFIIDEKKTSDIPSESQENSGKKP